MMDREDVGCLLIAVVVIICLTLLVGDLWH